MSEDLDFETKNVPRILAGRRDALARRIRNWASRGLPALIDSVNTKSSREYYRRKDLEEIPASIPPVAEHAALKRVYAAEFYTPAHAEQLFLAMEKLGWNSAETSPFRTSATEWVARSRKSSGGIWLNLGIIVPPGSKQGFRDATVSELPEGFDAAQAQFLSISPSLSCIVVTFDVKAETEGVYESIARSPLATRLIRTKRGHSIIDPRRNKRQVIAEARERFRTDILSWFKTNLPGAFSASGNLELFPTCELLFMDGVRTGDDRATRNLWKEYLGLDYGGGCWDSSDLPGLTFAHPVSHVESQKGHSVLYVERSDLKAIDNAIYGGDSDDAYLNRLSIELPGFIGHWGIGALLRLYQEELSAVRDGSWSLTQSGDASRAISRLQRVTSNSIDVSLLASELPNAFQNVLWNNCDFLLRGDGRAPLSFIAGSTQWSMEVLERLGTSDRTIRDLLVQQGNLINALEAIASQRTMSRLTVAMTLLTVAILILTAVMAIPVMFPKTPAAGITTEIE